MRVHGGASGGQLTSLVLALSCAQPLCTSFSLGLETPLSTRQIIGGQELKLARNHERILTFDTKEFPLSELVADALKCKPDELDQLHTREPEEFTTERCKIRSGNANTRASLRRIELLRRGLTGAWKRSLQKRTWENEYLPRIVRDVVGREVMPEQERLIYQRSPMLRFHVAWPLAEEEAAYDCGVPPTGGRNPGTLAGLHTDADYGHPSGEVNFFLPVNPDTFGTNSLYVEGDAMRGDFEPFELKYGEIMLWNGNSCRHCSPRNISSRTRISFDFRVMPGSDWVDPPKKKGYFQLGGYYADALEERRK